MFFRSCSNATTVCCAACCERRASVNWRLRARSTASLKEEGYETIIINNNPETVSTDFDTADRLYFEPLCSEDVMNIIGIEKPKGVVVAFGGQTAIKLTKTLAENNIPIIGTSADSIDAAEDRERFEALLERCNIKRPKGHTCLLYTSRCV